MVFDIEFVRSCFVEIGDEEGWTATTSCQGRENNFMTVDVERLMFQCIKKGQLPIDR